MSDLKPSDLLDLDALLSDEERQIRDLAREWVHDRILPEVDDWYERGEFPARELAKELARRADVVIENFRPGVMRRYGLDEPAVRATNAAVVYCSILGIGRGEVPGYDFLAQAVGGLMSVTGDPEGEPRKVGVALVDVMAGLHATIGIVAALRHRERTGEGQLVEIDLLSTTLFSLVNQASGYLTAGVVPRRMGNRHPSIAPYETLSASDGPIVVAVGKVAPEWEPYLQSTAATA